MADRPKQPLFHAASMRDAMERMVAAGIGASSPAQSAFIVLMLHADDSGVSWLTKEMLAAKAGMSRCSVKKSLTTLRAAGFLVDPVKIRAKEGYVKHGYRIGVHDA